MVDIPILKMTPFDRRFYPRYDNDTMIEVFFGKARDGYNTNFYAYTYQTPLFCIAFNNREELYFRVDDLLEFYYEAKELSYEEVTTE